MGRQWQVGGFRLVLPQAGEDLTVVGDALRPEAAAALVDRLFPEGLGADAATDTLGQIGAALGLVPAGAAPDAPALKKQVAGALRRSNLVALKARTPAPPGGGGGKDLDAPPPKPAVKLKVNPLVEAEPAVLVKRPYTAPARKPVRLRTDAAFDGTGIFTRSSDAIDFYPIAVGGKKLAFDGIDNKFQGGALSAAVTLYAEGVKPSAAMNDVVLKLALSGGTKTNGPDASDKMTSIEVTLDICEPRPAGGGGGDPAVLATAAAAPAAGAAPTDKFYLGRPVPVEVDTDLLRPSERAMLIIHKVKPEAFTGKLVLDAVKGNIHAFEHEVPAKGEAFVKLPHTVLNGKVPPKGARLFVQGMTASTAVRDTGFLLGVEGVDKEGDRVAVTAVYVEAVSNVETAKLGTVAIVPEKPARASKSKYAPSPRIIGEKYDVEVRPYLELATATAWKWSSAAAQVKLTDDTKEVLKIHGKSLSGAIDDVEIELLLTLNVGKMKKKLKLTVVHVEIEPVISGDKLKYTDHINAIKNPSGLVILAGGDAGDATRVPRIEITKITPDLKWKDDDERIAWWILGGQPAGATAYTGKADFLNDEKAKRGTKIQVFGGVAGDVLVQPYSGGYGYGMFRSNVVPLVKLKYRVNRIFVKAKAAVLGKPAVLAKPPVPGVPAAPGVAAVPPQPAVVGHPAVLAQPAVLAHAPTASHADTKKHIAMINIHMRTAGIELIPDTSAEMAAPPVQLPPIVIPAAPGVVAPPPIALPPLRGNAKIGLAVLEPKVVAVTRVENGHFDVEVTDPALLFQTGNADATSAIRINARNEVITFAYIHSMPGNAIATALLCPWNHAPLARANPPRAYSIPTYTLSDSGIPSTSLIPKTGIPDDVPAGTVKMNVLLADVAWQNASPATSDINLLWGIIMPTLNGDATAVAGEARILSYGNMLSHELGHILGLGHRAALANGVSDGVALPVGTNLMRTTNPPLGQNIDLIQVKAIRFSEALFRTP